MKSCFSVILVMVLVFVFCGQYGMAKEMGAPKLVLDQDMFDFKEVQEGKDIEHTFRVFNQGKRTLKINNVKPG